MAEAGVYYNGVIAGILEKKDASTYVFTYTDEYFASQGMPAISLSFSKTAKQYESRELFPFFYGMLAEGINKDIQCRLLKIDENDDFTRLIRTAGEDTIGAITVKELTEEL
ncbi:MAG: HipA N-terminal domain-containing protein [Bacteroidota bacterium]|nr:HipA N-terminal domain-containing protein [Bacteroidota bacterium]